MKPTTKYPFTIDSIVGNNVCELEAASNTDGEQNSNRNSNKRLRSPQPFEENPAQRHQSSNQHQRVSPMQPFQQQPTRQQIYYHQQGHPLNAQSSHMLPYNLPPSSAAATPTVPLSLNMPDVRPIPAYINTPRELQRQQYLMAAAQFNMARQAAFAQRIQYLPPSLVIAAQHAQFLRFPGASFILPRPKRIRTQFTPMQLLKLEETFEINKYIVGSERKALANQLGLSETKVKVWFQNRRTKTKRLPDSDGGSCGTDSSPEHRLQHDGESQSSEDSDLLLEISDSDHEDLEIVQ